MASSERRRSATDINATAARPPTGSIAPSPEEAQPAAAGPPALTALAVVAGGYALLFLAAIVAQAPVRLVDYRYLGFDFNDIWTAAGDVLAGRDPYLRPRFVTPPLSWLPVLPLASLSRPEAAAVFLGIDIAALALGLGALARSFGLDRSAIVAVALTAALSPATLMLLDRGNLDGLVFVALCGFVIAGPEGAVGPLALAAATCMKVYPGIFIPALLAQRRIRAAVLAGGIVLATVALTPTSDLAFLHSQAVRAGGMRLDENLSALAPFWLLDMLIRGDGPPGLVAHPAMMTGALLYAAALCTCLWMDARMMGRLGEPDTRLLLATYAGFCVGLPSLVYLYSGVCLFIPLAALGQAGLSARPATTRGLALALGVAMLPAKSLALTLGTGWAEAFNVLPPIGSVLFIAGAVALRLDFRSRIEP